MTEIVGSFQPVDTFEKGDSVSLNFEEFIERDKDYLAWIAKNPNGFVLNSEKIPRVAYMPLHTATCGTITKYKKSAGAESFTGNGYIKICSNDLDALLMWMRRYGAREFSALCSKCMPDISGIVDQVEVQQAILDSVVRELIADPEKLRKKIAEIPREPASFYYAQTKIFMRSAVVIAAVLDRANGICEGCSAKAPFLRAVNNEPFLEVHHRVRLADGGIDHQDNAIALCPNCHRKFHFG